MPRIPNRLCSVSLDERLSAAADQATAQDRALAIHDLLEGNSFALSNGKPGPYRLHIGADEQKLILEFRSESGQPLHAFGLSLTPFRRVVKDYVQICDSYVTAVRASNPQSIEAIDMARRAIHNEGGEILKERLKDKAEMDFDTARRLFTLISTITLRGAASRQPAQPQAPTQRMVLFACTLNAIRSPMAAAITHHYFGENIYAASAGVAAGDPDPFVGMVMDEIGIDLKFHRPHSFDDQEDLNFDLLITLSPEAAAKAKDIAKGKAATVENWQVPDPSLTQGSRAQILDAYRAVRDELVKQVQARFGD